MSEKKIDSAKGSFEANGTKYIIHSTMPIGRYTVFEKFQLQTIDDRDPMTMLQSYIEVYNLLNVGKYADAAVKLHNTLNGLERIVNEDYHPLLWIATCFIAKDGADFTKWDEGEARTAISDWIEEGFDIRDFFGLAGAFVTNFMQDSRKDSQSISEEKIVIDPRSLPNNSTSTLRTGPETLTNTGQNLNEA
jgi:hypothetical protein